MAKKREATLKEREEKERIQKKNWMRFAAHHISKTYMNVIM